MAEISLTLTYEECHALAIHLERVLKDLLIEEHRTRTPSYRESVIHQKEVLRGILNKVRQAAGAPQEAPALS
jgi:hypothetical protein